MNIRIAAPLLAVIAAVSAQGQLSVTPGSLPNGVVGAAYNQTLVASGGTAPYSWTGSTLSGSGSAGLSFTAGAITGTPTAAGPVTVSISLTDSTAGTPLTLTTSIGFNIAAAVAVTAPTSLAAGTVGVAYGPVTFTASGGTGTGYTWSATGLPANLSLSAAGVLSGTPAAGTQGPHTVNVTVTDSGSNSGSSSLPLTINLPTLAITAPTSLAAGTVGTAYGPVTFTATGGTGTGYAWSATGLPANLSLSPAGVLSGTPAAGTQGPHTVNVTVTDSGSNTGSSSLSLTINLPTLAITAPTSLAAGTVGAAYGPVTFTATGGTGTGYTWSATGLPANLSLSAAGVLSGTPAAGTQGPHTVNVTVTDSASNTGTNSLSLTINLPTLTITAPTTLAAGTVGVAYTSVTFTATGGTGTGYTWSQTGLPTGMSLSTSGVLSGTPGAGTQGPHTVNVTVTDSASNTDTNSLSLTINLPTLTITAPTTLAAGTVGVAYGPVTFTASGGTGTGYAWSQTGLPTGMSLSAAGVLSGTPAAGTQGPHTVNVTVTDSASNTDTNPLSLTINLPTLTITAPTSLAAGTVGVAYTSVTFTATGGTGTGYTWSQTGLPVGMSLSTSGVLSGTPAAGTQGPHTVNVTVTDSASNTDTNPLSLTINLPTLTITAPTSLAAGTVGVAYTSVTFTATGGTGTGYTWSQTGLPSGMSLSTSGVLSGTPGAGTQGPHTVNVTVTDSASNTDTNALSLTINLPTLAITAPTSLAAATVGVAYTSVTFMATGGTGTGYTWSATGLPSGMSLSTSGVLSGTPSAGAQGPYTVNATVKDSANNTDSNSLALTVNPAVTITAPASLAAGAVGVAYPSVTFTATGGTGTGYTWSATGLPTGLSLSAAGVLSGTPAANTSGPYTVIATVKDSANNPASKTLSLTIHTAVAITTVTLPDSVVGVHYSQTLAATGGAGTYTWSGTISGAGSAGLSFTGGVVSGTPTTAGAVSVAATVADSANPTNTTSKTLNFSVNSGITVTTASLPDGAAGKPYSQTLTVAGGTGTYTWSGPISGAGSAGLTFTGGVVSGTPTATGPVTVAASVSDTASPPNTASKTLNFTVYPALSISTASLPAAMVGVAYDHALTASGGTGTYTWSGTLTGGGTAGLNLTSAGHITGTPTTAGSVAVSASVSDTANPPSVATANLPLTVNPPTLTITSSALANGAVGTPYSQILAASGGTPPYTWSGTPPGGLTLAGNGTISGTPTLAGTYTVNTRVTDAQSRTADRPLPLRIFAAVSLSGCPAANGLVGQVYSSPAAASGGATPYTWSIVSGILPAGIQLDQSNGLFAGTPQLRGTFAFTVQATDPTGSSSTRRCSIAVTLPLTILPPTLADGVVGTLYRQTVGATGGTTPYSWSLASGSLPGGLTLDPSGVISGTPTQTGQYRFRLAVQDAVLTQAQADATIIVVSGLAITACPTATGAVGQSYSSGFSAAGGPTPYTWSLTAGTPPAGLTLDNSGNLAGTPTAAGTSTFTTRVTDQSGATASRQCSVAISTALTISTTTLAPGNVGVEYAVSLAAVGGTPPYTWSLPAGALPPGLTLNQGTGQITGTPTNAGSFGFTARVTDAAGTTRDAPLTIAVTNTFAVVACPTPAATIGVPYASTLNAVSGQSPYAWSLAAGSLPDGLVLNGGTGVITGTPTTAGSANFTVSAKDAGGAEADRACNISVIAANLSITTGADLPQAAVGVPYTQTLAASGGQQPYTWSVADGALPAGLQLSAGGVLAGTASQAGAYTFTVRVVDAAQSLSQEVFRLTVAPAGAPTVTYSGVPDIAAPAQQISPGVQIESAYPADITGTMTVSFTPDPGLVDDPAIQFAGGGRSVPFTIPAGQTQAVFANGANGLQTGTVAGALQLKVSMSAGGVDVTPAGGTKTFRVDRLAPQISSVKITTTSGGFQLEVAGYSTTREVTQGTFVFTPASGSSLTQSSVAVSMSSAAQQWFSSTDSANFGSQFLMTMPFTLQGATLSSVSVTLTNAQGTSPAVSASF